MPMSELPYGPEDLKEPPLEGAAFLKSLLEEKTKKYPDPPPLYQLLYDGKLNKDQLKLWIQDMYVYWDYTMYYSTGAIFVKTNDEEVRTHILKRMVKIEGKDVVKDLTGWTTPAYEELWLRFGEGLGISREEVVSWKPFVRTHYAVSTLRALSRWWEWSWLDGVATFYAADQLSKEYLGRAYDAIKKFYDVPEKNLEFFHAFLQDIEEDLPWEEKALSYWCCTKERQLTAARAFRNRMDIEYQLLVAVHGALTSEKRPPQVPRIPA